MPAGRDHGGRQSLAAVYATGEKGLGNMKFADFVATGAIRANLEAQDKEGVIREMVVHCWRLTR